MAGIRGKDTKPELILRRALHTRGFRYRLHAHDLPGRPDLVLPRYKAAIFIHGCFWHRHEGCRYASTPSTRTDFWQAKFTANIERDKRVRDSLFVRGWRVAVVWECALRRSDDVDLTANMIARWLPGEATDITIGEMDVRELCQRSALSR